MSLTGTFSTYPTGGDFAPIGGNNFDGFIAGIPGSWQGLLEAIYCSGTSVSFLRGILADPAFSYDNLTLNATGNVVKTGNYQISSSAEYMNFENIYFPLFSGRFSPSEPTRVYTIFDFSGGYGEVWGYQTITGGIVAVGAASTADYFEAGFSDVSGTIKFGKYGMNYDEAPFVFLGDIKRTMTQVTPDPGNPDYTYYRLQLEGNAVRYMDMNYLGTMDVRYVGVYSPPMEGYDFNSIGTFRYILQPLAYNGTVSGYFWRVDPVDGPDYSDNNYLEGLIGGTSSLYGVRGTDGRYPAVSVLGLGSYWNEPTGDPPSLAPLYFARVTGQNLVTDSDYTLLLGGVAEADYLKGGLTQGIYWRPGQNPGEYEFGFLAGTGGTTPARLFPDISMWSIGEDKMLQAIPLGVLNSSAPPELNVIDSPTVIYDDPPLAATEIMEWTEGAWEETSKKDTSYAFTVDGASVPWGITSRLSGGTYAEGNPPSAGAQWNMIEPLSESGQSLWKTEVTGRYGDRFEASIAGASIHFGSESAWVSVMGGKMAGLFDPSASTWQAVALSVGIRVPEFMEKINSMTTDRQRRAFYEATNIPCFEVGRVDLRGQSSGWPDSGINLLQSETDPNPRLGILDTTFFAPTAGGRPQIWASGNIRGEFTGWPVDESVSLTGYAPGGSTPLTPGISATFTMQKLTDITKNWGATITNGSGTVGIHDVNFQGGAAGTYTNGDFHSFSGTAAGIVK